MARRYLPAELEDFEYELAYYGKWTYIFPYGYVWVPGGIAVDWRPYWHGRWMWIPACGWTWLPYEPWGWATFHYGRWHWSAGYGWYWIPTTVWGPGWVHWYSGYDYVGWAPVNYWGRPGVVENSRVLTVIHKDQLRARDISKVALSHNSIKNIGQMTRVKTQPVIKQTSRSKIGIKSPFTPATKINESENTKRVKITSQEIKREKEVRNIPKTTTKVKPKKTSSTLGKITSITSSKSKKSSSSKSTSSKNSSSKKIKSSSIGKSKTTSKVKKSSPPKSSSRKRVSSKKVKKKK
jgi:hypothetical protein